MLCPTLNDGAADQVGMAVTFRQARSLERTFQCATGAPDRFHAHGKCKRCPTVDADSAFRGLRQHDHDVGAGTRSVTRCARLWCVAMQTPVGKQAVSDMRRSWHRFIVSCSGQPQPGNEPALCKRSHSFRQWKVGCRRARRRHCALGPSERYWLHGKGRPTPCAGGPAHFPSVLRVRGRVH